MGFWRWFTTPFRSADADHLGQITPRNRVDYTHAQIDGAGRLVVDLPPGAKLFTTPPEIVGVSMKPIAGPGHLQVAVPITFDQVSIGDLLYATLTHPQTGAKKDVFHQVIDLGVDGNGWYGVTQGTNNTRPDTPWVLRKEGVQMRVVCVVTETVS